MRPLICMRRMLCKLDKRQLWQQTGIIMSNLLSGLMSHIHLFYNIIPESMDFFLPTQWISFWRILRVVGLAHRLVRGSELIYYVTEKCLDKCLHSYAQSVHCDNQTKCDSKANIIIAFSQFGNKKLRRAMHTKLTEK